MYVIINKKQRSLTRLRCRSRRHWHKNKPAATMGIDRWAGYFLITNLEPSI